MAAAMNGMALHGGLIPYGGTFLVFTDYCRPSIRLSALMSQRVVYVMTHDSIGLGEDGPTHQPIEHLAALRAIPNLNVLPARRRRRDGGVLGAGASNPATRRRILALTRQAVPNLRQEAASENLCAKGGYVLREAEGKREVTLIATGSEVGLAVEARAICWPRTASRRPSSRCPPSSCSASSPTTTATRCWATAPRVAIEAAVGQGWHEWLRDKDAFVGLSDFGASAPAAKLYEHFGITAARIAERRRLSSAEAGPRQKPSADLRHGRRRGKSTAAKAQGLRSKSAIDLDKLRPVSNADVKGKRVIVRADLNVPVKDGKVTDATRLERLVPGLQDLAARGARVDRHLAFRPAEGRARAGEFAEAGRRQARRGCWGVPSRSPSDCIGDDGRERRSPPCSPAASRCWRTCASTRARRRTIPPSPRRWRKLGDIFVNDAFSAAHRAHASTEGLAHLLPAYAGPLMMEEIDALRAALEKPEAADGRGGRRRQGLDQDPRARRISWPRSTS